jgi:hypothetical protein
MHSLEQTATIAEACCQLRDCVARLGSVDATELLLLANLVIGKRSERCAGLAAMAIEDGFLYETVGEHDARIFWATKPTN